MISGYIARRELVTGIKGKEAALQMHAAPPQA